MANLVIVYGFGCHGCVYWTDQAWTADRKLARRYSAAERNTMVLPRGGCWTTAAA